MKDKLPVDDEHIEEMLNEAGKRLIMDSIVFGVSGVEIDKNGETVRVLDPEEVYDLINKKDEKGK